MTELEISDIIRNTVHEVIVANSDKLKPTFKPLISALATKPEQVSDLFESFIGYASSISELTCIATIRTLADMGVLEISSSTR